MIWFDIQNKNQDYLLHNIIDKRDHRKSIQNLLMISIDLYSYMKLYASILLIKKYSIYIEKLLNKNQIANGIEVDMFILNIK